jgi:hypothetical protein
MELPSSPLPYGCSEFYPIAPGLKASFGFPKIPKCSVAAYKTLLGLICLDDVRSEEMWHSSGTLELGDENSY